MNWKKMLDLRLGVWENRVVFPQDESSYNFFSLVSRPLPQKWRRT